MKNLKLVIVLKSLFIFFTLIVGHVVYAENESINFTIKNDGVVVFSDEMPLPADGMVDINDSDGNPQSVNARSVLNIVKNADDMSSGFDISGLIYYSSFNAFYLKCIDVSGAGELCDTWLYKVNDESPDSGMDQNILSGGENVVLFFGDDTPPVDEVDEEEEQIPAEDVPEEEVEEVKSNDTGGASGSRSRSVSVPDLVVLDPMPIPASIFEPIVKEEPKIEIKTQVVQKPVVVKKPKVEKKTVIQNTASVISTVNAENAVAIDEEPKKGWFKKILSWLFSF